MNISVLRRDKITFKKSSFPLTAFEWTDFNGIIRSTSVIYDGNFCEDD